MSNAHVNDEIIQVFALDKNYYHPEASAHLEQCKTCREAVAAYQRMFSGIQSSPPAVFDFDVKALVLPQLPVPGKPQTMRKSGWLPVLVIVLGAVLPLGIGGYAFRKDLAGIFNSSLPYLLFCLGPAATLLLLWLVTDILSRHRQKMARLEYY